MNDSPTVVLADDHPATRLGVKMALVRGGFTVVGEAPDRDSAVREVRNTRPDVCVLDVQMPGGGVEAAALLAEQAPSTSVVMLTISDDLNDVLAALRAGAVGYLLKDTNPERLPMALCGVLKGEMALPRTLSRRVIEEFRIVGRTANGRSVQVGDVELTSREWEILNLLRREHSTTQIAEALSLSPVTVRRHVSAAVSKLGVANRQAAVRLIDARSA